MLKLIAWRVQISCKGCAAQNSVRVPYFHSQQDLTLDADIENIFVNARPNQDISEHIEPCTKEHTFSQVLTMASIKIVMFEQTYATLIA